MNENPELQHYQSIVDDLRVACERANDKIAELEEERRLLKKIKITSGMYLASLNEDSNLDEGFLLLELNRDLLAYQKFVKEHS